VLNRARFSQARHLAEFRTYAILAIVLYLLFFSLDRVVQTGDPALEINNTTLAILLGAAVLLLASPNLTNTRYIVLFGIATMIYVVIEILPGFAGVTLTHLTNLTMMAVLIGIMRALSQSVLGYEEDVQQLVMDPDSVLILPYFVGERRVNRELARLQRAGRPMAIVYCTVYDDDPYDLVEINDETINRHIDELSRRRRHQVRLARAILSLVYKSDIVVQHGDALIVCLTEDSEQEAQRFVERLTYFLSATTDVRVMMGISTFPDNGQSFDQLVHFARGTMRVMTKSAADTESRRRRGDVLVDLNQRLEIEKQSVWVNKLAYQSPSSRAIYHTIKRVMDFGMCLAAAPLLIPLCGIIALLIKLDDGGPIFYMQDRTGFGGKRFRMFKFRTMVVNAPALPPKKIIDTEGNELLVWPDKDDDDPRITRIGRFLRKTSLDEIPQILNVVKGDMSIVGPRPTTWDVSLYTLHQTERLTVVPGITGLWQVSARESKNPDERLLWDLKYVEKMSFWLDVQILWRTVTQVFKKGGV
jgi:lipopolysaccharide/colanic/teichoic acid biosynthesis glycosyltransferase